MAAKFKYEDPYLRRMTLNISRYTTYDDDLKVYGTYNDNLISPFLT